MASVSKRTWKTKGGGAQFAWTVRWKEPSGKVRSKAFKSESSARKFRKQAEKDPALMMQRRPITVMEICDRYLRVCEQRYHDGDRMSRSTLQQLWLMVDKHIVPFIGKMPAADLTPLRVADFIETLRKDKKHPRTPEVVRKVTGILRQSLTEAQRLEMIPRNVLKDVPPRLPPIKRREVGPPDREQLHQILSTAQKEMKVIVNLAIFTGMRGGEICALNWDNIDLETGFIKVRHSRNRFNEITSPKTKAGRRDIPIPPVLKKTLLEWRLAYPRNDKKYLFLGKRLCGQTRPLSYTVLRGKWVKLLKECFPSMTSMYRFHDLRHAAASLLIAEGLEPKRLQAIMGHASITMTFDTYGHLFPDDGRAREALAAVESRFSNNGGI